MFRATGTVCGGGHAAGAAFRRCAPNMRFLVRPDICGCSVTEQLGVRRDRRAQPQAASQPAADRQRTGATGGGAAAALSGLGSPQVARDAGARRAWNCRATRFIAFCCVTIWSEEERPAPAGGAALRTRPAQPVVADGFQRTQGWPQPVGPLSVLDDHSRYLIALAANGSTDGEPVRDQLEEAFQRCGVPEGMLMDHGTPWWSTQAPSGRTHLSLWLMRQGIQLALEPLSASANPGQSGTLPRFAATRSATTRDAAGRPTGVAG